MTRGADGMEEDNGSLIKIKKKNLPMLEIIRNFAGIIQEIVNRM